MSIYEAGEEWCQRIRSPEVQFAPGEIVPEWVGVLTPSKYRKCLVFASHVVVLINAAEIEVRPRFPLRPGEALMRFRAPWWQRWYRKWRPLTIQFHGAPTVLCGVDRLTDMED